MKMDGVLVSLFCPTLYCELSFSGVLPSIVPYWNYNRSTQCCFLHFLMRNFE